MQARTDYDDVVEDVVHALARRLEAAVRAGVAEDRVVLDPGIGFAKTAEQSLELLRRLPQIRALGRPVAVGASRKSFLARISGSETDERLEGTLAVTALAVERGVEVLRVHDVTENVRVARTTEAVLAAGTGPAVNETKVAEPC